MSAPRTIGKYTILAELGHGGMADVYLARATGPERFHKLVVLKCLRPDVASELLHRTMFLDEARLSARLRHPNVVQVFEVLEHEGANVLAMEFLDGQPLNRVLDAWRKTGRRIDVPFAARVVSETLRGLDYAHELTDYDGRPLGIIHRDVTPHNIFLTYDGEVKLVDFGIAKASDGGNTTEVGVVKGKYAYLAPEQARAEPIDRRVDVFAAGVVLWEMLAGERLHYVAGSPYETVKKLLHDPMPSLVERRRDVDAKLESICARALAKDPTERYQTAAGMRDALEAWLEQSRLRPPSRDDLARRLRAVFHDERARMQRVLADSMHLEEPVAVVSSRPPLSSAVATPTPTPTPAPATSVPPVADAEPVPVAPPPATEPSPIAAPSKGSGGRVVATLAAGALVGAAALVVVLRGIHPSTDPGGAAPITSASATERAELPTLLRFCGSNTVGAELVPALVAAYLDKKGAQRVTRASATEPPATRFELVLENVGRRVVVEAAGTSTAFAGLERGACDVGMASRAISEDEAARLAAKGFGDMRAPSNEHVLALDGIAVIVHHQNDLKALLTTQIAALFSGATADFGGVGGAPGPVHLYARDERSGTMDTFQHLVLGSAQVAKDAKRFASSDELSDAVARDPEGLGFVGLAYTRSARAVPVSDGKGPPRLPTAFTVATEGYPLSRRLYLYTSATPGPAALDFLGFALSGEGQRVVRSAGFVDLNVDAGEPEACAKCSARYGALVKGARRVSLDFRFRQGSDALDSRGVRDLDRLVAFLRNQHDARVLLLGFSDAQGDPSVNQRLSRERAKRVEGELVARGVEPAAVEGLGDELPIASNDSEDGRLKNRRVEVWLAPQRL